MNKIKCENWKNDLRVLALDGFGVGPGLECALALELKIKMIRK